MIKRILTITSLTISTFVVLVALVPARTTYAQATSPPPNTSNCGKESANILKFPTWYKYLDFDEGSADCDIKSFNPETDIAKVALAIFEIILRISGLVAVGFVIYGGFQYILSQGESDRLKGARGTIINALIGIAIALSATAIVNLVGSNIIK